jgi:hypothetical protein
MLSLIEGFLKLIPLLIGFVTLVVTVVFVYNIILIKREKISKVKYSLDTTIDAAVEWSIEVIKKFRNETVYVFAGEFDYNFYLSLEMKGLKKILEDNKVKIIAIGGPHVSIPDGALSGFKDHNAIFRLAEEIYLRKDNQRTIGHGVVGEKTNVCVMEEPHDEFEKATSTLFLNSPYYCDLLRDKVAKLLKPEISEKIVDRSDISLSPVIKTKSELKKGSIDSKVNEDVRLKGTSILLTISNPIEERRRYKCLAQVV